MTPGPECILVNPDPIVKEEKTTSGLYVETDYKKRSEMEVVLKTGIVVAIGNNVLFPIKEGQKVYYNPFDSYRIDVKGMHKYDVVKAVGVHAYE